VNVLKDVSVAETPKGSYIVELVEKAGAAGEHVAIVTHSVHVIRALRRQFKGCSALSEGTTQTRVDEILAQVAEQKVEVLLVLIPRFSNGVNLQNFDHVVICEPLETHEAERQVISRFMRMGATRPTLVHRLICLGTVDEFVFRAHQQNIKVTGERVFGAIAARHHH
jgi:predicted deacetylase